MHIPSPPPLKESKLGSKFAALLFLLAMLALSAPRARACPPLLASIPADRGWDLCSLSDRYHSAKRKLVNLGYSDPDRIAEVVAPRFIAYADWNKQKTDPLVNYNPWLVYCPAPATWGSWQSANQQITVDSRRDLVSGRLPTLSVAAIQEIWRVAMNNLPGGHFRGPGHRASSYQWTRKSSLTDAQVYQITRLGLNLSWTGLRCWEELDPSVRARFQNNPKHPALTEREFPPSNDYFMGDDGHRHQCGYIEYTPGEQVQSELNKLSNEYNAWALQGGQGLDTTELLERIGRVQQWMVGTHAFDNGNGRTSRFLMDRIVIALGLPAPLLADQNADLYSSTAEWGYEVGDGIRRAVDRLETCVARPNTPGCRSVTFKPPTVIPAGLCLQEKS